MKPTLKRNCDTCRHLITDNAWMECHHRAGIYMQRALMEDGALTCKSLCTAWRPKAKKAEVEGKP